MKQIILTLSIFLFSFSCVFAQTLYTRTDTLAISQDTVTLKAGQFRGDIQWQHSIDGKTWDNLTQKTDSLLKVAKTSEGYYRAKIVDGNCLPTYSDTAVVMVPKTANNNIAQPEQIVGATFVDRDNSVFTYVSPQGTTVIPVNTVLVDDKQESDIRVVTNVAQNGDTLVVETKQGTLEDLFINAEFKLSTQVLPITEKSAYLSTGALAKAMVDGRGVIHPVEIIDNNAQQPMLKSAQAVEESLPGIYFRKDFSGDTIWEEGGASILFEEGYYQLGAELDYEFKFEQQGFDWANKKFPNGKLTKFKVSTRKEATDIEAKMVIKATTSKEFKKEDTKVIKKDVFNKTFKYLVFVPPYPVPIPFWATVKVDLMRGSSSNISGEATVSGGATGNFNLELGASYENGKWTTIKPSFTPGLTLEGPDVDAKVNVKAQIEVYPHIEVSFYNVLSPYMDIVPYIRSEMEYSLTGNYKYDLYSGVNARLGVKAEVFGNEVFDHSSEDLNLYEKSLYTAPKKVQVVSGANQKAAAGKPLPEPIIIKVVDSKDNPVKNTIVNFKASMGKLRDALLASPGSANRESGLLYANIADSTKLAAKSDTTGLVKINWTLADSTAKHQLETFLVNGKDSIREDTRDTITADVESCGCDTTKFEYFIDSRDGHRYKSIKIGNQTWMAENLAFLPYNSSRKDSSSISPRYYIHDQSIYAPNMYNYSYYSPLYGVLYNRPAALSACPQGWHLPSDAEWNIMIALLGGPNNAGTPAKSEIGWYTPNKGTTNSSCFSALPAGYYDYANWSFGNNGFILGAGLGADFWSSSLPSVLQENGMTEISYARSLHFNWTYFAGWSSGGPLSSANISMSRRGFSIRCIKD